MFRDLLQASDPSTVSLTAMDSATHTVAITTDTAVLADRSASLSLRLRMSTAEAITEEARDRGLTQKQLVCQALAAAGVAVTPSDLEDHMHHAVIVLLPLSPRRPLKSSAGTMSQRTSISWRTASQRSGVRFPLRLVTR